MAHKLGCLALACTFAGYFAFVTSGHAESAAQIFDKAEGDPDRIDITDAILAGTSPDCADYATSYTSEVTDLQQQRIFDGAVIVEAGEASCVIRSNSTPNHDFGGGSVRNFATPAAQIASSFTVSRRPEAAERPSVLTHGRFDAVLLNGVVIHILSAGCYAPDDRRADGNGNVLAGCRYDDPWLIDPMSPLAPFAEENHHGHTQPDGRYHYHGNPMALFDSEPGPDGSPLIGYAADGFPIYGSYFRDESGSVRKAESGYALRIGERLGGNGNPGGSYDGLYRADYEFTGAGDLDACNGMTLNGVYAYYVTDTFPWVIACLTGTPDPSFSRGAQ